MMCVPSCVSVDNVICNATIIKNYYTDVLTINLRHQIRALVAVVVL